MEKKLDEYKSLENILENFKDKKIRKIENDELIRTLMNFAVMFLILAFLPLLSNIESAHVILPTAFAFSPALALIYFIVIYMLYLYYKRKKEEK
ncbi:MAG: hypothetical protein QXW35_05325 [Candidatus Aenigmatarchaeota archaeon]